MLRVTGFLNRWGLLATKNTIATADIEALAVTTAKSTGFVIQGLHTEYYDASAWQPTVSNGCAFLAQLETTAARPDINHLAFNGAADEHAQINIVPPKKWNGGTITFRVHHTHPSAITTGVAWALEGVSRTNDEAWDVTYSGTPIVVTDTYTNNPERLLITATSAALTIALTPGGAGADNLSLRLFRDVSDAADNTATDALFQGIEIDWTLNAETDA